MVRQLYQRIVPMIGEVPALHPSLDDFGVADAVIHHRLSIPQVLSIAS